MLQTYLTDVRDLLRDANAQFFTTAQLTRWINKARYQTCLMTSCIRVLVAGGSPYETDSRAGFGVAGALIPGAYGSPQGASSFNTIVGQEKYPFSYANPLVQAQNGGVKGIIDVMSVSVSWGSTRPTLDWLPFEDLQAYYRAWSINIQNYPRVFSTNGMGETGEVWVFPIPGQATEMEWMCACAPLDLNTDSDPEAIPDPHRGCVKWFASKLAYEASQRWGAAGEMGQQFDQHCILAGCASDRGKIPSFYLGV